MIERSTLVNDANGTPILAYFGNHIVKKAVKKKKADVGDKKAAVGQKRLLEDTEVHDGIPVSNIRSEYPVGDDLITFRNTPWSESVSTPRCYSICNQESWRPAQMVKRPKTPAIVKTLSLR